MPLPIRLYLASQERFGLCPQAEKINSIFTVGCESSLSIPVVDVSFVIEYGICCLGIKVWFDYFYLVLSKYFAQNDEY